MTQRVTVLGLDLGRRTGYAFGSPGQGPWSSGSLDLAENGDPDGALWGLTKWLDNALRREPVALIAHAAPLSFQAMKFKSRNERSLVLGHQFAGIVAGLARGHRVRRVDVAESTVRKFFTGSGRQGDRAATKAATIARCVQLRYVAPTCADDNECDAIAMFMWASATHFGKIAEATNFALFRV